MIVTDLLNRTEMLTDCNSISIERKLGGEQTIQFTAIRTERNIHSYELVQDESLIIGADETFVVKDVEETPYHKNVIALNEFFDCIDDYVDEQWPDGLYTIQESLQLAFSTSNWSYVIEGNYPQRAKLEEFGNDNAISMLNKVLSAFNSEYEIDSANKRVIVKRRLGVDTDYQIRDRHNIKAISKSIDSKDVKTAVKVFYDMDEFGNYNKSVIYYSPNRNKYRKTKWREPIYSDTITTESQAISTARLVLKDEPDITFSVEFTTLQQMGYNSDDVQLGNGVFLIDERMNLESRARIVGIKEFYKLVNGQMIKDAGRSPIATISNVQKTVSRALVQQQKQQAQIERTAVKQQRIYNGCTISKEDGFKAVAENGVEAFLNATEGIAIKRDGKYKFYASALEDELVLDGKLNITNNNITMLEGFKDDAGGTFKIYDNDGLLNVRIGSNKFSSTHNGGSLVIYADNSIKNDPRLELLINDTDGAGELFVMDEDGNRRISLHGVTNGDTELIVQNDDGSDRVVITPYGGYVNGSEWVTRLELDNILSDVYERLDDLQEQADDLQDQIDDLQDQIDDLQP